MNFFNELGQNRVLVSVLFAWVIAQGLKVLFGIIREKKFNFYWLLGSGGMPSSHSAGVMAMSTTVGIDYGINSPFFGVVLILSLVIMFDAQGVRYAVGKQAEILNRIVDDIYSNRGIPQERLKELLGHTPLEVLVGALIGILSGIAVH